MAPRFLALLAAAMAVAMAFAPESVMAKVMCEDKQVAAAYAVVRDQMDACATKTGVKLTWPMVNKNQRSMFCAQCLELKARIVAEDVPDCRLTSSDLSTPRLLKVLEKLFAPCVSGSSASDSMVDSDNGSGEEDEAPGTPTPAAADTTTSAPSTANAAKTTKKPAVSAPAPTNGTSAGANGATQTVSSQESSMSIGVVIGIAAGCVVLIAIVAFLVVRRRRSKTAGKFDNASDADSSTGRASTTQFQFSLVSGNNNTKSSGSKSSGKKSSSKKSSGSGQRSDRFRPSSSYSSSMTSAAISRSSSQVNLWEDPVIIAARVPKDKIFQNQLLARGGFGEVYQGIYNRQQVAIKMLLPETRKDMQEITALFAEVKLMASLEHERIVTFVGVAWDSLNDVCVLSEFMDGGDLRGTLLRWEESRRSKGFNHDKIKIALHVAHALTYLHSLRPQVLHRDLKSKNILLDSQLNAKLTDFGVSRESSYRTMTAGVGTSLWMAPEVMMGERYDDKADIFSFGIVLSELDTHAVPYRHVQEANPNHRIPDTAVLQMVSLGKVRVKFSSNASLEMVELGNACVAVNPRERPSAADVLYTLHNVLKGMYLVM